MSRVVRKSPTRVWETLRPSNSFGIVKHQTGVSSTRLKILENTLQGTPWRPEVVTPYTVVLIVTLWTLHDNIVRCRSIANLQVKTCLMFTLRFSREVSKRRFDQRVGGRTHKWFTSSKILLYLILGFVTTIDLESVGRWDKWTESNVFQGYYWTKHLNLHFPKVQFVWVQVYDQDGEWSGQLGW